MPICRCGECNIETNNVFAPGHDQRFRVSLERRVGGLLALGELVELCEDFAYAAIPIDYLARGVQTIIPGNQSDEEDE